MDKDIQPVKINDLNKTQLILLAILLSFVVSIATGIVTVTLMQQASPAVNQTINRVVQQTIEKVVPDYSPTKVQTVVVKEDDLVVDAISKTRATIFGLYESKDATDSLVDAYSVGGGNFIVTSSLLDKTKTYLIKVGDSFYDAGVSSVSPAGYSIISISKPDDKTKALASSVFGKDASVKPGQTIAIIGSNYFAKGNIQSVIPKEMKDESGKVISSWNVISSSSGVSSDMLGELVVNLDGEVIGLIVSKGESGAQILGIDAVTKFIAEVSKAPATPKAN